MKFFGLFIIVTLQLTFQEVVFGYSPTDCSNHTNYYCAIVEPTDTSDNCKLLACFFSLGNCYSTATKDMMLAFDKTMEKNETMKIDYKSEGVSTIYNNLCDNSTVVIHLNEVDHSEFFD